jgi:hypothetical protein
MSTYNELTVEQQRREDIMNSFSDDVIRAAEHEIYPFHKSLETYPIDQLEKLLIETKQNYMITWGFLI